MKVIGLHYLSGDVFVTSVDDWNNLVLDKKSGEKEEEDDKTKIVLINVLQRLLVVGIKHVLFETPVL